MWKPQPVTGNNAAKKGVDMSAQMSYHTAIRKPKKWYKNGFELLTGTSVGNAWILYNKIMPKAIPIHRFKESLVEHPTKFNSPEISPDTNDTRARIVERVHIIEAANSPLSGTFV